MHDNPWHRIARTRVARRRALAGGAMIAASAVAASVIGCEGGGDAPRGDGSPVPGGTLRFGTSLPMSYGLDPQIESGSGLTIFPKVYGYLGHVDPRDDTWIADHAESVEQPDAVTYLFRLRADALFHDVPPANGRVVTARDVVRSIERYRDNPLVVSKTWHATVLDRAEAPDVGTVSVTTKRPYAYSLHELGGLSAGAILPIEAIDQQQNLSLSGAGSGPMIVDNASSPEDVRLRRNDAYFGERARLDGMSWSLFADDDAKVEALSTKAIDSAPHRDRAEADRVRAISDEIEVVTERSLAYLSLGMRTDRPPFNDVRVREAIDISLDRGALIRDVAFGDGTIMGPVNPHLADGYWSLRPEELIREQGGVTSQRSRYMRARALLEAAGASNATARLRVADQPQLVDVARVLQAQLAETGLRMEVDVVGLLEWFVSFRSGEFDLTLISQLPYESPDVPTRLYHSLGPDGMGSPFKFGEASIDARVEQSWGEMNRAARRASLLDAQRLMMRGRPMVQLFSGVGYASAWGYVRERSAAPASLGQYAYGQWLALPVEGRAN